MNNPYTLTFGKEPKALIDNVHQYNLVKDTFVSEEPATNTYLITGVRGSGKTVLLTRLAKYFSSKEDWIVVELNPENDMLEYLASSIYEQAKLKMSFLKKEFNFSFHGLSFSISGENPVSNVVTLLERMLEILAKKNKRILICVDDVYSNQNVKTFAQQYQIFLRKDYPLFLLMTGLFENVRNLQNEKSLTFLYRAIQIYTGPLSLINIAQSFEKNLNIENDKAVEMAVLTKGYAFAFQVLGYILFESNKKKLDRDVIEQFDSYLKDYVYEKLYFDLPLKEKELVNSLANSETGDISSVMDSMKMNKENISQYRNKLIKKGIIAKIGWGKLDFTLPRFREFVQIIQKYE